MPSWDCYLKASIALWCACALTATGYQRDGNHGNAVVAEPCPYACRCTSTSTTHARHRWHRLLAAYRMRHLVYGQDNAGVGFDIQSYRKPDVTSDNKGREMTCMGLQQLPNNIPRDISKLTLYGDSRGHRVPRDQYQSDVADDVRMVYHQLTSISRYAFRSNPEIQELSVEGNRIKIIHPSDLEALRNLRKLRIRDNQINVVSTHALRGMDRLQFLDLSKNELKTLATDVFLDAPLLQNLDLSGNRLRGLQRKSFIYLTRLEHLDLSGNVLKDLPKDIFVANVNLKVLKLDFNQLRSIRPHWLTFLEHLEQLSAKGNMITELGYGTFRELHNLKSLNLESNRVARITADDLEGLNALEYLTLKKNHVAQVANEAFRHTPALKRLYLDWNSVTTLNNWTFFGIDNLEELTLSGNQIQDVPLGAITGLKKLKRLDLSHNAIKIIRQRNFYGLLRLRSLRLDHNGIRSIESEAFAVSVMSHFSHLTWLYLSHNGIGRLERDMLYGLAFLKFMNLANNEVAIIEEGAFSMLPRVQTLLLNNNRIARLDPAMFKHQRNLRHLNMASNYIRELHPDALQGLAVLEDISLQGNLIQDVGSGAAFSGTPKLASLTLKGNRMRELNLGLLDTALKVKYVDASGNDITRVTLPRASQRRLHFLSLADNKMAALDEALVNVMFPAGSLHLYGNPWMCDCRLSWLQKMLSEGRVAMADKDDIVCKSPANLEGEVITALREADFRCHAERPPYAPSYNHQRPGPRRSHSDSVYVPGPLSVPPWRANTGYRLGDDPGLVTGEDISCHFLPGALENNTRDVIKSTKGDVMTWIAVFYDVTEGSQTAMCAAVRLQPRWFLTSSSCVKGISQGERLGLRLALDADDAQLNTVQVKRVLVARGPTEVALIETDKLDEDTPQRRFPCVMSKDAMREAKSGRANSVVSHIRSFKGTVKVKGVATKVAGNRKCPGNERICATKNKNDDAMVTYDDALRPSPLWVKVGRSKWALAGFRSGVPSGEFEALDGAAQWISRYIY